MTPVSGFRVEQFLSLVDVMSARDFYTPQKKWAKSGQNFWPENENPLYSVVEGVFLRCEAESNRCTRFCRPVPNRSAIAPIGLQIYVFYLNLQKMEEV